MSRRTGRESKSGVAKRSGDVPPFNAHGSLEIPDIGNTHDFSGEVFVSGRVPVVSREGTSCE